MSMGQIYIIINDTDTNSSDKYLYIVFFRVTQTVI